ncbi:MAG: tyrosine-type recombinase/integrase [Polyangiales bacterium]
MAGGGVMLRKLLAQYVALRKATGFTFRDSEILLRSFVAFAIAQGDRRIRGATAVKWAAKTKTQAQRYTRLRAVSRFAAYLRAEDPRHEMPPQDVFVAKAARPTPRIFTETEVAHIVACAAELGAPGSFQGKTYSTLYGLLAATGLRLSEATGLRLADVTDEGLIIRQTKFRKSRFVPLHPTTRAALAAYLEARRRVATDSDSFFVSRLRQRISRHQVLMTFRSVAQRAGILKDPSGKRPRVHDLRHTFAVRALERSPVGRDRVERHIVALTTYLGHARIESTYWYLESTPRLLKDIAAACDGVLAGGAR